MVNQHKTTLKISLSPRDSRFLPSILTHQIEFWHDQFDEILLVLDLHGYNKPQDQKNKNVVVNLVIQLQIKYNHIRLIEVDYSPEAKNKIANEYFSGKNVPNKTHRYGPFYSYYFGLFHTKYDYVFNIDSDIIFGGHNKQWVKEAIEILQEPNILTCSPLPGPPTTDRRLKRQEGDIDNSLLRKVYFTKMSTRLFFINKFQFKKMICPLPIKISKWSLLFRAIVRLKPIYELPEDTISDLMVQKGFKRIDFLGTNQGIWSLHPPYRNEEFYQKLDQILLDVKNNKIPEEQRGDYDINESMINWQNEIEKIQQASIKRKIFRMIGFNLKNEK